MPTSKSSVPTSVALGQAKVTSDNRLQYKFTKKEFEQGNIFVNVLWRRKPRYLQKEEDL
jgi:hypothetical protein